MLRGKLIGTLIAAAGLAVLAPAAMAIDEANDPYWHAKPQTGTQRQTGVAPASRAGTVKDKAAARAAYEKSRAGQAEAEALRGPQHLQDKHNP